MVELLRVGQECRVNEEQVDRIPELKVASPLIVRGIKRPPRVIEGNQLEGYKVH